MIINVKVYPNSGKSEVIKVASKEYKILLKAKPKNNKANIELLKILKKEFKKEIKIIGGKTSRKKVIEILE